MDDEVLLAALAKHMASGKLLIMASREKLQVAQLMPGFQSSPYSRASVSQPVVVKREATFEEYWDHGPEGPRPSKESMRQQLEAEGVHFYEVTTD